VVRLMRPSSLIVPTLFLVINNGLCVLIRGEKQLYILGHQTLNTYLRDCPSANSLRSFLDTIPVVRNNLSIVVNKCWPSIDYEKD
jgi:hypothetical protein